MKAFGMMNMADMEHEKRLEEDAGVHLHKSYDQAEYGHPVVSLNKAHEDRITKAEEDMMKNLESQCIPQEVRRTSSKYGFRFLKHERSVLEKWYEDHAGRTAPIQVRKEWVSIWNDHRKASKQPHCEVSHQQVKQWFENTRRTRNHKGKNSYLHGSDGMAAGYGQQWGAQQPYTQTLPNPRLYLAATTEKMHSAINQACMIVGRHIEQLQKPDFGGSSLSNSQLGIAPNEPFKWDSVNLKAVVDRLLVVLDNQLPAFANIPSPRTTVPIQSVRFQVFKQLLDIDRQIEPEWDALKQVIEEYKVTSDQTVVYERSVQVVDMYMTKLEQLLAAKAKVLGDVMTQLSVLPNPTYTDQSKATPKKDLDINRIHRNIAWMRSWTMPPDSNCPCHLDSKMCAFQGCFLEVEQRANMFLGVPMHASALASAVCFSLESGEGERLSSQEAQNLVNLYEAAALQELELSDQLDRLWNLKPIGSDVNAMDSWRFWLEDHHNADIFYPLKALADAVPAADQQYGFISVMRNSLMLSTNFLQGLRNTLPPMLFMKCMSSFTQAHYLFAASAMLKELYGHDNSQLVISNSVKDEAQ